jgi:hypothetical protein
LSPISDLTDFLSGEKKVTTSAIIPVLHNLKTKIPFPKEEDTTKKHQFWMTYYVAMPEAMYNNYFKYVD